MWTTDNRPQYDRKGLRYPSDLTDAEWDLVKPLIPRAKRGGRKRKVAVREVMNGILYILSGETLLAAHHEVDDVEVLRLPEAVHRPHGECADAGSGHGA